VASPLSNTDGVLSQKEMPGLRRSHVSGHWPSTRAAPGPLQLLRQAPPMWLGDGLMTLGPLVRVLGTEVGTRGSGPGLGSGAIPRPQRRARPPERLAALGLGRARAPMSRTPGSGRWRDPEKAREISAHPKVHRLPGAKPKAAKARWEDQPA
jgi:hypothetical protein